CYFFFQAEDGIRDRNVTGVQTCALPICRHIRSRPRPAPPSEAEHPCNRCCCPANSAPEPLPCGTTRGCRMRCPASSPPPPGFATARASRVTHPSSISSGHRTRRTTGPVNEPRHGAPLLPTTQRPERATPEQFPG